MKKTIIFFLVLIYTQLAAQRSFVFLGSYNSNNWTEQTEGIAVYELDTANGQLTKVASVTGVRNPSFINLSPDGRYLYACTESKTPNAGSVSSFVFNKTSLQFINKRSSNGENPVYVSVHNSGKWLVNVNYTAGTLAVHPLLPNGRIDSAVQTIQYKGSSINKERQDRSHVHAVVFSPDGRHVFVSDLGTDKIYCYPFNGTQKKPLLEDKLAIVHTLAGSGPRHLSFHPNGKIMYCIEELSGYVSAYSYKNGKLRSIQRIAAHNDSITTGFESADIHCSPDGKFLYASNRGQENNLAIFSIQPDGRLKWVASEPTGGKHPRTFALDPSGKFVIVANVVTNTVTVLRRNVHTGLLTNTGQQITMPSVSSVQTRVY